MIQKKFLKLSKKNKMKVFINFFREYFPDIINLKKSKNLYFQCHANYSPSLKENGIHHLNLLGSILKDKMKILTFSVSKKRKEKSIFIKFKNGELTLTPNIHKNIDYNNIQIINKKYFLRINLNPFLIEKKNIIYDTNFDGFKIIDEKSYYKKIINNDLFKHVYENILNCYKGKKFYNLPIKRILQTEKLIDEIQKFNYIDKQEINAVNKVMRSGVLSDFLGSKDETKQNRFYGGKYVRKLEKIGLSFIK